MIEQMFLKMIENSPVVAVLMWLVWRNDKRTALFWDLCLKHLSAHDEDET